MSYEYAHLINCLNSKACTAQETWQQLFLKLIFFVSGYHKINVNIIFCTVLVLYYIMILQKHCVTVLPEDVTTYFSTNCVWMKLYTEWQIKILISFF